MQSVYRTWEVPPPPCHPPPPPLSTHLHRMHLVLCARGSWTWAPAELSSPFPALSQVTGFPLTNPTASIHSMLLQLGPTDLALLCLLPTHFLPQQSCMRSAWMALSQTGGSPNLWSNNSHRGCGLDLSGKAHLPPVTYTPHVVLDPVSLRCQPSLLGT